ncbi:YicC/YloC family endoribonuclease [Frigidibacter sp. ROC022]|uniref:YicC/YloC family endoribonuclease n=1 Tax=Frigidibacter sp. ROC022 TaxID=2971796 RepID=UPI00215AC4F8|nr:YicC/YloC family endoribonuclease [Frigidibacter sp. ROC022]MCR8726340.1 YicC family protein [Frigidibacter sp. ROC022]
MTGFAGARGAIEGWDWVWDLRAVNGRGLDLRLRLPDWVEGLEAGVRRALQGRIARGSVTLSLRLTRRAGVATARLDPEALAAAVAALAEVEAAAEAAGVTLQHSTGAEVLALRGVMEAGGDDAAPPELVKALLDDLPGLLDAFQAMRRTEGAALARVLTAQLDQIAALTAEAAGLAEARRDEVAETLRTNLARVLDNSSGADPDRVAQELALLAVKADVTEEIDRLTAHVAAARALLSAPGPVGRKLDFLTQEFLREANTLCSKSGSAPLTRVGLDLKAVIDQMREQVQNVE